MFTRPVAKKPAVSQANSAQRTAIAPKDKIADRGPAQPAPHGFDIGSIPILSPAGHDRIGNGAQLESALRADMEAHFGHDLGDVRVHTDAHAAEAARNMRARAYALGNDIVFGASEYAPATPAGRTLLAHELAHTVQQRGATRLARTNGQNASLEHSADSAALRVASGLPVGALPAAALQIARKPTKEETEAEKLARHRFKAPPTKSPQKKSTSSNQKKPTGDPAKERAAAVAEAQAVVSRMNQSDKDDTSAKKSPPLPPWKQKYGVWDPGNESADAGKSETPVKQDPRVRRAQEKFRKRHNKHSPGNLYNIDRALALVTKDNPDLLIAYYEYYSDHKLTDELENKKRTGATSSGDTDLNEDVLALQSNFPTDNPLLLLGETLLHEYAHTPQGGMPNAIDQAIGDAKAYPVELFFAERAGDEKRAKVISNLQNSSLDSGADLNKMFRANYDTIKRLYGAIDKGGPWAEEARQMSVEFISKNEEDYGPKLRAFIAHR